MNIGRRIYYEVETGIVLWDKGEMSGNVFETTVKKILILTPHYKNKNIDYIDLAYGEDQKNLKYRQYEKVGKLRYIQSLI